MPVAGNDGREEAFATMRQTRGVWLSCWSGCVVAAAFFIFLVCWFSLRFGLNSPPAASGDELSYDSIGWQLSQGNGFREDFTDPEFRRPYEHAAELEPESETIPEGLPGYVTYRPPLFPLVVCATDLLAGRQFWLIRLVNIAAFAGVGGILWSVLFTRRGGLAAVCGILLFATVDTRTRLYARTVLTEPIALLLVTVLSLLLMRLANPSRIWVSCLAGVAFAFLILDRSAFVLWFPFLCILHVVLVFRSGTQTLRFSQILKHGWRVALRHSLAFTVATLLVLSPWVVRNVLVLKTFMPFGTQGLMELSAGFSDEAVERRGIWFLQVESEFLASVDSAEMTTLEREVAKANFSRKKAIAWIRQNPWKAVSLGFLKMWNEYRPHNMSETLITIFFCVGLAVSWRERDSQVLIALHLINGLAIAATWSVEGRFIVPLLFSIHYFAAIGLMRILQVFPGFRKPERCACTHASTC